MNRIDDGHSRRLLSLEKDKADALFSTSRPVRQRFGRPRLPSTGPMLAGAALVAWSAGIHLHLWIAGYRHISSIGPLFLFQSIAGFAVAAAVTGTRRVIPALIGMALLASSIGGLLLSAWVGLFGFHDGLDAPFAKLSLVVEGVGVVVLAAAGWLRIVDATRHEA
jgi:hypothetical protein